MSKNGKAITDAMKFISSVGQQCESLFNVFKSQAQPLLAKKYEDVSWKKCNKTIDSCLLNIAVAWNVRLEKAIDKEAHGAEPVYLGFQMSFISDNEAGGLSPEPLIHINLWSCATNVSGDDYMGFPMCGFSDHTLEDLKAGQPHLLRWTDEEAPNQWTFSLRLADINDASDVQTHIIANIEGLFNDDRLKNTEKVVVWQLGSNEEHCKVA